MRAESRMLQMFSAHRRYFFLYPFITKTPTLYFFMLSAWQQLYTIVKDCASSNWHSPILLVPRWLLNRSERYIQLLTELLVLLKVLTSLYTAVYVWREYQVQTGRRKGNSFSTVEGYSTHRVIMCVESVFTGSSKLVWSNWFVDGGF